MGFYREVESRSSRSILIVTYMVRKVGWYMICFEYVSNLEGLIDFKGGQACWWHTMRLSEGNCASTPGRPRVSRVNLRCQTLSTFEQSTVHGSIKQSRTNVFCWAISFFVLVEKKAMIPKSASVSNDPLLLCQFMSIPKRWLLNQTCCLFVEVVL